MARPAPRSWSASRRSRRARAARRGCSAGSSRSARRPARPGGSAARGARRGGTPRGAGRRPSCRCPGRPARRPSGTARSARSRPARAGWWRRCRASGRRAGARSRPRGSRSAPRTRPDAEVLVLERGEPAVLEAVPPPQPHAHRLDLAGPVERQADRRPPVDHHRVAAGSEMCRRPMWKLSPSPVVGRVHVEPAEEQRDRGVVGELPHPQRERRLEVLPADPVAGGGRVHRRRCARASAPAARGRRRGGPARRRARRGRHAGASAVAVVGWGSPTLTGPPRRPSPGLRDLADARPGPAPSPSGSSRWPASRAPARPCAR